MTKAISASVAIEQLLRKYGIRLIQRNRNSKVKKEKHQHYGVWKNVEEIYPHPGSEIILGTSDLGDYLASKFIRDAYERHEEVFINEFIVIASKQQWKEFINSSDIIGYLYQLRDSNGYSFNHERRGYLDYTVTSSTVTIRVYGDSSFINEVYLLVTNRFEEVKNVIEWVYNTDGGQIEVPITSEKAPCIEMYPFIENKSLEDYYDKFIASSASILVLIGPPGTGKTTFIRGLLQHTRSSAVVTYDPVILSKDYMFAQFIEGDKNILVLEDADNFLNARTNGNDMMHKFLNVGDGLITMKNKKIIFSTNLPSLNSIDSALIRPGRCYDVVKFDLLNFNQAQLLAKKFNIEFNDNYNSSGYTIAEIFHKKIKTEKIVRKVGFV